MIVLAAVLSFVWLALTAWRAWRAPSQKDLVEDALEKMKHHGSAEGAQSSGRRRAGPVESRNASGRIDAA